MKRKLLYIISVLLLTLLVWSICHFLNWQPSEANSTNIKKDVELSIQKIIASSNENLKGLKAAINSQNTDISTIDYGSLLPTNSKENLYFITKNDSVVYWSSNRIHPDSINLSLNESFFTTSTISGIHLYTASDIGTVHKLIPLVYQYPIQNQHLNIRYHSKLKIPSYASLTPFTGNTATLNSILWNKSPILELTMNAPDYPLAYATYIVLLYVFVIISLLLLAIDIATRFKQTKTLLSFSVLYIAAHGALFYLFSSLATQSLLSTTELFSPSIFASSITFASLGHFALFSIHMLAVSLYLFQLQISSQFKSIIPYIIQTIVVAFILFEICQNTTNLINNSTFSLLIYKLVSLPYYALIAFASILIQFASFYLLMYKSYRFLKLDTKNITVIFVRISSILLLYFIFYYKLNLSIIVPLFLIVFFSIYDKQIQSEKLSSGLRPLQWLLITLFSFFLSYIILDTSATKHKENDELIASNLSNNILNEHDFETETRLVEIEKQLTTDKALHQMISDPAYPLDQIENYMLENNFSELKEMYDIQFIICWPDAILDLNESDSATNCYNYFNEIFLRHGERLQTSNFYYLDNKNGRISYFGQITVNSKKYDEISLFIDLESQVASTGRGYPEILKSLEDKKLDIPDNYSFARYINGKLVTSTGTFNYSPLDKWLKSDSEPQGMDTYQIDKYVHVAIKNTNNTVVVSRPQEMQLAFLLLFSYIFLLTYLFIQLAFSSTRLFTLSAKTNTIERKLKVSFAVLLIFSFLLLSSIALYFTYDQQTSQQEAILIDKLEIIHAGLEQYGGNSATLQAISEDFMLDMYLNDLSNMFKCDINIYTTSGELFATSRPEIFDLSLISTQINPYALFPLKRGDQKVVIQNEKIGTLNYASLYMLLTNDMNTPIGIVNVPFFVSSQNLARVLSNYLVISINLFIVFLVLTIIFSTALGKRLVQPIRTIQQKIGRIRLGQQNERIVYKGEDELKELVEQYNILVDELEKSAQLLAQSERETAWRKMARQIAHEIKNPLTPMRLSIQQLQRLSKDDPKHFENMFSKTSTSLIEQIDSLSDIASSFANFAKTPRSNFEPIELNTRLETILAAFQNMQNISIELIKCDASISILADKNQFTQLINNLLKNAIQAIPKEEKGFISIKVSYQTNTAIIEISDNGKGVPLHIKDKLFEPNFTTKTSGMGLGLAISKNIVKGMNGHISFDSEPNSGTTFMIEIPAV